MGLSSQLLLSFRLLIGRLLNLLLEFLWLNFPFATDKTTHLHSDVVGAARKFGNSRGRTGGGRPGGFSV